MTRYPSTHGVARTRLAALPTSRYAAGQELGIMAGLRNLAPRHALHIDEAVELAERRPSSCCGWLGWTGHLCQAP